MKVLITICARGGSKGIPGKNIKSLNGQPLIAYTIKVAQAFAEKYSAVITLSTDSEEIKYTASNFGLKTDYVRPDYLATDKAGKVAAIHDILKYEELKKGVNFDFIIDLDITSPLRTLEDIENAWTKLKNNNDALNIFSVSPANRNPYFNMVEETDNGFVKLVKGGGNILSRQSAPTVYDMNASFYVYRRSFFHHNLNSTTTDKSLAYVVPHMCFDLDHPIDFDIMELLMKNNKLDLSL